MISWIIIVVLAVIGVVLLRINHFRHRMWIIAVILLAIFLYTTLYIVNTQNQLDFTSAGGFMNSMKVYGGWLANGFGNMKTLAGHAINMDWASSNASFVSGNNTKKQTQNTVTNTETRLSGGGARLAK